MSELTSFLWRSPEVVAPELLGWLIYCSGVTLRVVETEAYLAAEDQASHARSGPTARCGTMFGPVARAYVYKSYGVHFCFNIVCHEPETGGAVLVRAGEVVEGESLARARRGGSKGLADGPGKLAQCLGLSLLHDGSCLSSGPITLRKDTDLKSTGAIVRGPRIGITLDRLKPYRFWYGGHPAVSRPRGPAGSPDRVERRTFRAGETG